MCVYCIVTIVFMLHCVNFTARYEIWFRVIPDFWESISEGLNIFMIIIRGFQGNNFRTVLIPDCVTAIPCSQVNLYSNNKINCFDKKLLNIYILLSFGLLENRVCAL